MESPLLRQPQPQARRAPAAVAALAVAAVALLSLASLNVHARPFLLQVGEDPEYAAANGEKCWMCPCCAGCESSGAARAAGCSAPGAKTARKEAPVNAAKTSRKQATLHSVADAEPQAAAVAARVQAAAKPAAKPKQVAQAAKTAEVGQVKSSGNFQHDDGSLFGKGTFKSAEAAPRRIAHRSKLGSAPQQDNDEAGNHSDKARPISSNNNRLKDSVDIFEDGSYLSPHKYHRSHLTKKMGKNFEEDVIAPWFTGPDSFGKRTTFKGDGTIKTLHHYSNIRTDPLGLFAQNPTDEEPWYFAEGKHWDNTSPETKGFSHGEDWSKLVKVKAKKGTKWMFRGHEYRIKGNMTHGPHKLWEDTDDPQWGWDHQFADWDPDGDMNARLMWGDGGLALSGVELPNDKRLDSKTNIYEEPAMKGHHPWEMSWMDPRLEGDDFVGKDDYLASMHPEFKNPVENKFADLDEEGKENKDLVFGDNEGLAPSGQKAVKAGMDDPASLRQRMDLPINDNWNFASDSKVNSNTVKDLMVNRNGAFMPLSGEPLSDALTGTWMGINGVGHSDYTPGFAATNDYPDNKDDRWMNMNYPITAKKGGRGGVGVRKYGTEFSFPSEFLDPRRIPDYEEFYNPHGTNR